MDDLKDQFMIQCQILGCIVLHSSDCFLGTTLPSQLKSSCVTPDASVTHGVVLTSRLIRFRDVL